MATRRRIRISDAARARQVLADLVDYCIALEAGECPQESAYGRFVAFQALIAAAHDRPRSRARTRALRAARAATLVELLEPILADVCARLPLEVARERLRAAANEPNVDFALNDDDVAALVVNARSHVRGAADSIAGMGGPREAACTLVAARSAADRKRGG